MSGFSRVAVRRQILRPRRTSMSLFFGVFGILVLACCGGGSDVPACHYTGGTCTYVTDCCDPSASACSDGTCMPAAPSCRVSGQGCSQASDCCTNLTCPRVGPPSTCRLGDIGDPCTTNGQCMNGLTCNGAWCTAGCKTMSDCNGGDSPNECVLAGGVYQCFPLCSPPAYTCTVYGGTDTQCVNSIAVGGGTVSVCLLPN